MGPSRKLHSGKKEQNRIVKSLRTFFLEPPKSLNFHSENSGKEGRRPAWLSKELDKVKYKKEKHWRWNQGQVSWEEKRSAVWLWRDRIRKLGKVRYSWSWTCQEIQRIVKMASIGMLVRHGRWKKMYTHNTILPSVPQNGTQLMTINMEKAEVYSNFVCLCVH